VPLSYQIDKQNNVLVCKVSGALSADDVRKMRANLREDEAFSSDLYLLFDMLDNTEFGISPSEFRELAAESPMGKQSRRAYVAPSELAFGLLRIFAGHSLADPAYFRVFRDLAEARLWLGLDEDKGLA
jgi:hypothetical protein